MRINVNRNGSILSGLDYIYNIQYIIVFFNANLTAF